MSFSDEACVVTDVGEPFAGPQAVIVVNTASGLAVWVPARLHATVIFTGIVSLCACRVSTGPRRQLRGGCTSRQEQNGKGDPTAFDHRSTSIVA